MATDEEQKKEKARVCGDLILTLSALQAKVNGGDEGSDSSDGVEEPSICVTATSNSRGRVPVYKWDIRFRLVSLLIHF